MRASIRVKWRSPACRAAAHKRRRGCRWRHGAGACAGSTAEAALRGRSRRWTAAGSAGSRLERFARALRVEGIGGNGLDEDDVAAAPSSPPCAPTGPGLPTMDHRRREPAPDPPRGAPPLRAGRPPRGHGPGASERSDRPWHDPSRRSRRAARASAIRSSSLSASGAWLRAISSCARRERSRRSRRLGLVRRLVRAAQAAERRQRHRRARGQVRAPARVPCLEVGAARRKEGLVGILSAAQLAEQLRQGAAAPPSCCHRLRCPRRSERSS